MQSMNTPSKFIKVVLIIQVVILVVFLGAFMVLVNSMITTNTKLDILTKAIEKDSKSIDDLFNAIASEIKFNRDVKYETKMIDCYELESQSNDWRVRATLAFGDSYSYPDTNLAKLLLLFPEGAKCIIERQINP